MTNRFTRSTSRSANQTHPKPVSSACAQNLCIITQARGLAGLVLKVATQDAPAAPVPASWFSHVPPTPAPPPPRSPPPSPAANTPPPLPLAATLLLPPPAPVRAGECWPSSGTLPCLCPAIVRRTVQASRPPQGGNVTPSCLVMPSSSPWRHHGALAWFPRSWCQTSHVSLCHR